MEINNPFECKMFEAVITFVKNIFIYAYHKQNSPVKKLCPWNEFAKDGSDANVRNNIGDFFFTEFHWTWLLRAKISLSESRPCVRRKAVDSFCTNG